MPWIHPFLAVGHSQDEVWAGWVGGSLTGASMGVAGQPEK